MKANRMKTRILLIVGAMAFMFVADVPAQQTARPHTSKEFMTNITEPLGGQPAAGARPSVPDLDYQVAYQRAFEAVLWSIPAVSVYGFYRAAMDIGGKDNTILSLFATREAEP